MSESDVSPFEMDNNSLSDTDIEAVLAGDQTPGPDELQNLMCGLREQFESSTDVPVGAALAEFIDVVDLTTTGAHAEPQRKRKMITGIGAFIATTTGKVVLGTTLAAASVGGAHAVDLVDVPGLPETSAEVIVVDEDEGSEEKVDAVVPTEDHDEDLAESSDGDDESDDTDDEENHGQVVSDFVHTTDLEGCEKGQATSDLASSKHDDDEVKVDDDEESHDSEDDDDEHDSCKEDGEDDSDHEDSDDDDDEDDDDSDDHGNGRAKGNDRKADHDDDDDDES